MANALSTEAVAEKAQHEPHCPWSLTGLTTAGETERQSTEAGRPTVEEACKKLSDSTSV